MSTYAIGDIQGCYDELIRLLDTINFDERNDQLWFVGDLVNRGPKSLATLRFVKSLGDNANIVLGNHDLHLLAVVHQIRKPHRKDTLDDILETDELEELVNWIRQQPLLFRHPDLRFTMIHAGLPPQWTMQQATELAREAEALIQSDQFIPFLSVMYGDQPDIWSDVLTGDDRYRFIINCLTRTRYCDKDGKLNLDEKGAPGTQHKSLTPWYALPDRQTKNENIIFGHWSTIHLGNEHSFKPYNVYPLDTGCLWGGELTAMRLEDERLFSVPSSRPTKHTL